MNCPSMIASDPAAGYPRPILPTSKRIADDDDLFPPRTAFHRHFGWARR